MQYHPCTEVISAGRSSRQISHAVWLWHKRGAAAMVASPPRRSPTVNTGITRSGAEFIALIALSMSLVALSIDSMLPALGSIAADLGARAPNDRQLVLTVFFAGLTVGLLVYGPISDSIGRKPTMYIGVALYILGGLLCAFAPTFTVMIAGRILQGFGAGSPRIVAIAMVRDLHGGRNMARNMSFVMAIFI